MRKIIVKIGTHSSQSVMHIKGRLKKGGAIGIRPRGNSRYCELTWLLVNEIDKSAGDSKEWWLIRCEPWFKKDPAQ